MERLYIVTGASGHLGGTIVRQLRARGAPVRGLILPTEQEREEGVAYVRGDVRDPESLRPLFENAQGRELCVIHAAGMVDISGRVLEKMREVNVEGTRHVIELCRAYGVKRLVYVSSVHAIPEPDALSVMGETDQFSPDFVVGDYAKTKAEATRAVLDAAARGLDAVVVHPSGILGPFEGAGNHLVQMVSDYVRGRLPACVRGGYDFVDVRDVAEGCLAAMDRGRSGSCYILSNRHYEVCDVLSMARSVCGGRKLPVLPMWLARAAAPFMGGVARLLRRRPLYTAYSLYALRSNDRFDHSKATVELGYRPRDMRKTITDTIAWLAGKQVPCV